MTDRFPYPYKLEWLSSEKGGGFLVIFPDLSGCMADGETEAEALANAADALRSYLATAQEFGDPFP